MDAPDARARALTFCQTCPTAVVLTVWPSGRGALDMARQFLTDAGARVVHETEVPLAPHAHILSVLALYWGEEWLESNCYYYEQPLPDGPPAGPFAGAQWKTRLCFKSEAPLHVFVADAADAPALWQRKYAVRARMADATGNAGNSCIHLTDDQSRALRGPARPGPSAGCDDSYAFSCARCLLHPASLHFLNERARGCDLGSEGFVRTLRKYAGWLTDRQCRDFEVVDGTVEYAWPPDWGQATGCDT